MKSNVVYKYPLNDFEFMAAVIRFLNVGIDPDGSPCVWALVNPDADEQEKRIWKFYRVGTGWIMDDNFFNNKIYLGTLTEGPHMWHYWAGVGDEGGDFYRVTEQMSPIEQDIIAERI